MIPLYKCRTSPNGSQSSLGWSSNSFPISQYVSPVTRMASVKFLLALSETHKSAAAKAEANLHCAGHIHVQTHSFLTILALNGVTLSTACPDGCSL